MRPYKFRFWGNFGELNEEKDECEKEMLYGDQFCFFNHEPINVLFADKTLIVMQFTGLTDKNGREIYEGDVLEFKQYIGGNFVENNYEKLYVVWNETKACFNFKDVNLTGGRQPFSSYDGCELKIIGNIYENEL